MEKKYWVPALEKADGILRLLADEPDTLRLIDISERLGIHKSSMFSLLQTMEALGWVSRDKANTYALGPAFARLGGSYYRDNDLISAFRREAQQSKLAIGETIQLARLEGSDVLYLAKVEAPTPVRLASEPGMKFPAHATALGKAMLATLTDTELQTLYPVSSLPSLTPFTLTARESLFSQLAEIRRLGCAYDEQEAVVGFCCVAAPIRSSQSTSVAVSCSMPLHLWETKRELAQTELFRLAARLSALN